MKNKILSTEAIQQFQDEGYLFFDPKISNKDIDQVLIDIKDQHFKGRRDMGLKNAWITSESVRKMATHPRILSILTELYHYKPLPFHTLNFHKSSEFGPHSDVIYHNSIPSGYMCGVQIAFEEITERQGPLLIYPRSHKMKEYTMQDFDLEPSYSNGRSYFQHMEELVRRHKMQPIPALLKKGQAVLWASNLMHEGGIPDNRSKTRKCQVSHYFFEGCEYYISLLSHPGKTQFIYPKWIV